MKEGKIDIQMGARIQDTKIVIDGEDIAGRATGIRIDSSVDDPLTRIDVALFAHKEADVVTLSGYLVDAATWREYQEWRQGVCCD